MNPPDVNILQTITFRVAKPFIYVSNDTPARASIQLEYKRYQLTPFNDQNKETRLATVPKTEKITIFIGTFDPLFQDDNQADVEILYSWQEWIQWQKTVIAEHWKSIPQFYNQPVSQRAYDQQEALLPQWTKEMHHHTRALIGMWKSVHSHVVWNRLIVEKEIIGMTREELDHFDTFLESLEQPIQQKLITIGMHVHLNKWLVRTGLNDDRKQKRDIKMAVRKNKTGQLLQGPDGFSWRDEYIGLFWCNWLPFQPFMSYSLPKDEAQVLEPFTFIFKLNELHAWNYRVSWNAPTKNQMVTVRLIGTQSTRDYTIAIIHSVTEASTEHIYVVHEWNPLPVDKKQRAKQLKEFNDWWWGISHFHRNMYKTSEPNTNHVMTLHRLRGSPRHQMCHMIVQVMYAGLTSQQQSGNRIRKYELEGKLLKSFQTYEPALLKYVYDFVTKSPNPTHHDWVHLPQTEEKKTTDSVLKQYYEQEMIRILTSMGPQMKNHQVCWIPIPLRIITGIGTLFKTFFPRTVENQNDDDGMDEETRNRIEREWTAIDLDEQAGRINKDETNDKRIKWFERYGSAASLYDLHHYLVQIRHKIDVTTTAFLNNPSATMRSTFEKYMPFDDAPRIGGPYVWTSDDHVNAVNASVLAMMYRTILQCDRPYVVVPVNITNYGLRTAARSLSILRTLVQTFGVDVVSTGAYKSIELMFEKWMGIFEPEFSHANVLFVDRVKQEYLWFEPHGQPDPASMEFLNYTFARLFPTYRLVSDAQQCNVGLQTIHARYVATLPKEEQKTTSAGFCLAWTNAVTVLKMTNPSWAWSDLVQTMYRGGHNSLMGLDTIPRGKLLQDHIYSFVEAIKCLVVLDEKNHVALTEDVVDQLYAFVYGRENTAPPPYCVMYVLDPNQEYKINGAVFPHEPDTVVVVDCFINYQGLKTLSVQQISNQGEQKESADQTLERLDTSIQEGKKAVFNVIAINRFQFNNSYSTILQKMIEHVQRHQYRLNNASASAVEAAIPLSETLRVQQTATMDHVSPWLGIRYVQPVEMQRITDYIDVLFRDNGRNDEWVQAQRSAQNKQLNDALVQMLVLQQVMQRVVERQESPTCRPVWGWLRTLLK